MKFLISLGKGAVYPLAVSTIIFFNDDCLSGYVAGTVDGIKCNAITGTLIVSIIACVVGGIAYIFNKKK